MSDDEVLRRRAPLAALAAVGLVLGGAWWLRAEMLEDIQAFKAFCSATHPGEPWEHVQERAAKHGWEVTWRGPSERGPRAARGQGQSDQQGEWLVQAELWTYRAGCVVGLERGRVVSTRFAELP